MQSVEADELETTLAATAGAVVAFLPPRPLVTMRERIGLADSESRVPFLCVRLPRPRQVGSMRVRALPTLVYTEYGEELERIEPSTPRRLSERDLDTFLSFVEALQEPEFNARRFSRDSSRRRVGPTVAAPTARSTRTRP